MQSRIITMVTLSLMLWSANAPAQQTEITTIDGIYVERDTVVNRKNETISFRLNDKPVINQDVIAFDIPGIGEYLEDKHLRVSDVYLLIQNRAFKEFPAFIENVETGIVRFQFEVDDLAAENRELLYTQPGDGLKRLRLGIAVGEDITLYYSPKAKFYFEDIQEWKLGGVGLIIGMIIFVVFVYLKFPSIIKDTIPAQFSAAYESPTIQGMINKITHQLKGTAPDTASELESKAQGDFAYSFSKTQLLFWSVVILCSFIYICSLTGSFNSINSTALILLGISAGTTAAGGIVKNRQDDAANQMHTAAGSANNAGAPNVMRQQLESVKNFLESRMSTRSFLRDILSDNQGINIQRLQAFIFNIIFGIMFIKSVVLDYTMPSFGETELGLLGLSNGFYAFMKNTENK